MQKPARRKSGNWKATEEYHSKLQPQLARISKSQRLALARIIENAYRSAFGIAKSEPAELWQFALSKGRVRESRLSPKRLRRARQVGEHIRRSDASYTADLTYDSSEAFLSKLNVSFCDAVQKLLRRAKNDAELARWLGKLLALQNAPPITPDDLRQRRKDADNEVLLLLRNWCRPGPEWARGSFCVYADKALAKMLHYRRFKRALPPHRISAETERIGKVRQRLGLVPARRRLFRDVEITPSGVKWVPVESASVR